MQVGLADDYSAGIDQLFNHAGIGLRFVAKQGRRSPRGGVTLDIHVVFHHDGQAMQRQGPGLGQLRIQGLGPRQRQGFVRADKGV